MRGVRLILTVGLVCQTWATQTGYYSCRNNHLLFKIELTNGETLYDVYAEDYESTCGYQSKPLVMTSTSGGYFIDHDLSGAYDGTNDGICGATGASSDLAELHFMTQGLSGMYESTDYHWIVNCDFSTGNIGFTELSLVSGSPINGYPADITPTLLTETVVLELLDSGSQSATSVALGDSVYFRVTLTPSALAVGVRITSCVAQKLNGVVTGEIYLIDANGCADSNGPLADTSSAFVGDNANGAVATTVPVFEMFKFTNVDTLFVKCEVTYCPTASDVECRGNHCVSPGSRRKREANTYNKTYTGVTVRVAETREQLDLARNGNRGPAQCDKVTANYTLTFSAVIGVLAFVLLLGLAMVVYLFLKVRRHENKEILA